MVYWVLISAVLTASFPHIDVPTKSLLPGEVEGDSICVLSEPQQLVPAYAKSIFKSETPYGDEFFIAIPDSTDNLVVYRIDESMDALPEVQGLGPCDTLDLSYFFPALNGLSTDEPVLSTIVSRGSGGTPFAFFQHIDTTSTDTCASGGVLLTDFSAPDSGETAHRAQLSLPLIDPGDRDRIAVGVWDSYTWQTYFYTSADGGSSFEPGPGEWSDSIPRPDTCSGGPTVFAVSPRGLLAACHIAETTDSTHIGLQPWLTTSSDWGSTWSDLRLLDVMANGSALNDEEGYLPYGSFSGGTTWYGADLIYSGETPYLFHAARRSYHDSLTAEGRLWPTARAILCSYPENDTWRTVYVSQAMVESSYTYDSADWPTAAVDEEGRIVLFWSDRGDPSSGLDIWACGHDPSSGIWTVPVRLTDTPGNEAMLEAVPTIKSNIAHLLLADEVLLIGEETDLAFASLDISPVWQSGIRTDIPTVPTSVGEKPPLPARFVRLAPNPSRGIFEVITSSGVNLQKMSLFDISGRLITTQTVNNAHTIPMNVHGLPSGSYVLKWWDTDRSGSIPVLILP